MTAIVLVVIPGRDTSLRFANSTPGSRKDEEKEPQRRVLTSGKESDPPFWTWFIENPRLPT